MIANEFSSELEKVSTTQQNERKMTEITTEASKINDYKY